MSELTPMNSDPSLERFLKDIEKHQLIINFEHGVHRDITIKKPGTIDMHYNITTRPGYLTFTGDMGCYVFQRLEDMFKFFRGSDGYRINPGYWHEKVQGQDKGAGIKEFSADKAERRVKEHLEVYLEDLDMDDPNDAEKAKEAREAIDVLIDHAHDSEVDFYSALSNWDEKYSGGLDFSDWHEMDFTDYSFHYIWACYAIVHAIKLYDAYKLSDSRTRFEAECLPTIIPVEHVYFDQSSGAYRFNSDSEYAGLQPQNGGLILVQVNAAFSGWQFALNSQGR